MNESNPVPAPSSVPPPSRWGWVFRYMLVAAVVSVFFQCAVGWFRNGTADPRCVFGVRGYLIHHYFNDDGTHVRCEYDPDVIRELDQMSVRPAR